jgi:hypothetical protein
MKHVKLFEAFINEYSEAGDKFAKAVQDVLKTPTASIAYNQKIVDSFPQIDVEVKANKNEGPLYFTIKSADFNEILAQNDVSDDVMNGMVKTFKEAAMANSDHSEWTWNLDRYSEEVENAYTEEYGPEDDHEADFEDDSERLAAWKKVYTALAKNPKYWLEKASFIGADTGSNAPAFFTTRKFDKSTWGDLPEEDSDWLDEQAEEYFEG